MTTKKTTNNVKSPKLNLSKADSFTTMYANWVQVAFSPYDISMVVGIANPTNPTSFDVEQNARIIFHPSEAKAVAIMLLQGVNKYESQFGGVATPALQEAGFDVETGKAIS